MRWRILFVAAALLIAPLAFAGTYTLNDWCFYVNSLDITRSCNIGSGVDNFSPPLTPGTFDYVHIQDNNLGTVTATMGPGTYNVFAIFNYDINPGPPVDNSGGSNTGGSNPSGNNPGAGLDEYATAAGTLAVGQVYSVNTGSSASPSGNTPGASYSQFAANDTAPGSIYTQFATGSLDNTNHVPSCANPPCDVAVALGFTNLVIPTGNTGTVTFNVSSTPPPAVGFFVQQQSASTGGSLFFSATYVDPPGVLGAVPEPASVLLMGSGTGLLLWFVRRRRRA